MCKSVVFLILFSRIFVTVNSVASVEEWGPYTHNGRPDDFRLGDPYTAAYLNVTFEDVELGKNVSEKTETGRYGGGYIGPAAGYIVHVRSNVDAYDHTGCTLPFRNSRSGEPVPISGEPWIALIQRGGCNFEVKVENAFRSNAVAVLVYNNEKSKKLERMKLNNESGSKYIFICK